MIVQGTNATVSATLLSGSSGIGGQSVTFTLAPQGADQACSSTTTSDGTVSCTISNIKAYIGKRALTMSFAGDNAGTFTYPAQTASQTVNVEGDAISYTGPATFSTGSGPTITAKLTSGGSPVVNETLTITLAPLGADQSCNATTDANGVATCQITDVTAYRDTFTRGQLRGQRSYRPPP